jgi:hypothetical protein
MRSEISESIQNSIEDPQRIQLKLKNIIGRNAYSRHSNLFYDFDER